MRDDDGEAELMAEVANHMIDMDGHFAHVETWQMQYAIRAQDFIALVWSEMQKRKLLRDRHVQPLRNT